MQKRLFEVFNYIPGNCTCKMGVSGVGLVKLISRVGFWGIVKVVCGVQLVYIAGNHTHKNVC